MECVMFSFFLLSFGYTVRCQAPGILNDQILGCFRNNPSCHEDRCSILHDYAVLLTSPHELTECAKMCRIRDYTYFGKQISGKCLCGKHAPRVYGQVNDMLCHQKCVSEVGPASDEAFRCGGDGVVSVYTVCSPGRYGAQCENYCHCLGSEPCSALSGICPSGGRCVKGWRTSNNLPGEMCSLRDCLVVNGECLTVCRIRDHVPTPDCSCLQGFRLVDGVFCEDLNECESVFQNCSSCVNTNGSSVCTCMLGFMVSWHHETGYDSPICIDVDECAHGTICGGFNCSNTFGSYRCICPSGYASLSNGTFCQDVDECALETTYCHYCVNTPLSFRCECNNGFALKNYRCEDVDECSTGQHNCYQCNNTIGSYICLNRVNLRRLIAENVSAVEGCRITVILLSGGGETDETSSSYGRADPIRFQANIQSTCQITQTLNYMWKISPYTTGSSTGLPLLQETLQVDYYVFNPMLADVGKYLTELTVLQPSMTASRFIEISNRTFFRLVMTELRAVIHGGSAVTIDIKESVKLDASLSLDADSRNPGSSSLQFSWYCVKGRYPLPAVAGRSAGSQTICSGVWSSPYSNQHTSGGFPTRLLTLNDCQQYCIRDQFCIGIDIDSNPFPRAYCWVQIQSGVLSGIVGVTHYKLLNRTGCRSTTHTSASAVCRGLWSEPQRDMHVSGGIPTSDDNYEDCRKHCLLDSQCVGIDLSYILDAQYCWLSVEPSDLMPVVGVIHLDLMSRIGCEDTTNVTASDCIANEHVLLSAAREIAEFPTSGFLYSSLPEDYTFTVVVSKPNFLGQSASQIVTLIDESPTYNININCELNCDVFMNPSYSLVLKANCLRCTKQSYEWSLSNISRGAVQSLTSRDTNGGLNSAVLDIKPGVFKADYHEFYTINLVVTFSNRVSRNYSYSFETTSVPRMDRCFVEPTVGYALKTDFEISCTGGTGNPPLSYLFTLHRCTGGASVAETSVLYKGLKAGVQSLKLPGGDPDRSYMVCISATISDRYAVETTVELRATVSPDTFVLADLQEMTRNASRLKAQGDIAGSTCLLDLIAFTTNALTKRNLLREAVVDKKTVSTRSGQCYIKCC